MASKRKSHGKKTEPAPAHAPLRNLCIWDVGKGKFLMDSDGQLSLDVFSLRGHHDQIMRAVNAHDDMLAALREVHVLISHYWPLSTPDVEPEKSTIAAINKIDAAIAKAKGAA